MLYLSRTAGSKNEDTKIWRSIRLDRSIDEVIEMYAKKNGITITEAIVLSLTKFFTTKNHLNKLKGDAKLIRDNAIANDVKKKNSMAKNVASIALSRATLFSKTMNIFFNAMRSDHHLPLHLVISQKKVYLHQAKNLRASKEEQKRMLDIFSFLKNEKNRLGFEDYYERSMRNPHEQLIRVNKPEEATAVLTRMSEDRIKMVSLESKKEDLKLPPSRD